MRSCHSVPGFREFAPLTSSSSSSFSSMEYARTMQFCTVQATSAACTVCYLNDVVPTLSPCTHISLRLYNELDRAKSSALLSMRLKSRDIVIYTASKIGGKVEKFCKTRFFLYLHFDL